MFFLVDSLATPKKKKKNNLSRETEIDPASVFEDYKLI